MLKSAIRIAGEIMPLWKLKTIPIGLYLRSNEFEFDYMLTKAGKPVDKTEWLMTLRL